MKKLILVSSLIFLSLLFMSNRGGRGSAAGNSGAATGAPGETGSTCGQGGCHSAGQFSPEVKVSLLDDDGNPIQQYIPGQTYTAVLKIETTGLPAGYGFQMVCLTEDENSVDGFSDLPDGVTTISLLNRQYVEQFRVIPVDSIPMTWTAPEEGTGPVTFYAAGNAINGNGSPAGDGFANDSFTFEEAEGSSVAELGTAYENLVFPNPVVAMMHIAPEIEVASSQIMDYTGKVLIETGADRTLDLSYLLTGTYLARISDISGKVYTTVVHKN